MFNLVKPKLCLFVVPRLKNVKLNCNIARVIYSCISQRSSNHINYTIQSLYLTCHNAAVFPPQCQLAPTISIFRVNMSKRNRIFSSKLLMRELLLASKLPKYYFLYFKLQDYGSISRNLVGQALRWISWKWCSRPKPWAETVTQCQIIASTKFRSNQRLTMLLYVPENRMKIASRSINLYSSNLFPSSFYNKNCSNYGCLTPRFSLLSNIYSFKRFTTKVGTNSDPQTQAIPLNDINSKPPHLTDEINESGGKEFRAKDLLQPLTIDQKREIFMELQLIEAAERKKIAEEKLASWQWRSKFGRPTSIYPSKVDPSGTYCEIPQDWLQKKVAESAKVKQPTWSELRQVAVFNALPFVGFGFLDNLIMIIAGDYIDTTIGIYLGISTMAAAALGNTISDLAGIMSAWYVEYISVKIGVRPPDLTQDQQETSSARWCANIGRGAGVCFGCILGMFPLLLLSDHGKDGKRKKKETLQNKEESVEPSLGIII